MSIAVAVKIFKKYEHVKYNDETYSLRFYYKHIFFYCLFILLSRESDHSAITSSLSCRPSVHHTKMGESRLPALFPTCETSKLAGLMLSVKQGSCKYQIWSHWFNPTRNQSRVCSSRGGRSYHSAIGAVENF